jgi:putative two-component system response regulator
VVARAIKDSRHAPDGLAVFTNEHPSGAVGSEAHLAESVKALRTKLDSQLAAPRAQAPESRSSDEPLPEATGLILVVDEDRNARGFVAGVLSAAGYEVREVGSAWEARVALEQEHVALLLTEVSMARETGLDLVRFTMCEHAATATLLMSALDDPAIARAASAYGAHGYLSKPLSGSAALIGVTNALRQRDRDARARAEREHVERTAALGASALVQALERVEGAAEHSRVLQQETIQRWAEAAEYREPGIGRHVKRMSRYCGVLGEQFGLHLESLELASVLHDVGKARIPDTILLKPAPLTADERLAIETHADIGYEMLRDSGSAVLDLAAVIARTHHEKFDGSGYPRGLAAEKIPLEGRIAAVADVFDALTCDRAYRQAWSVDSTIAWMTRERGKHFDPRVLDALLASMDQILAIRSELITG